VASTDQLLTWALTVLVLVAVPGPSVVFTINRALTAGRRTALLVVAGNAFGAYLQVIAVAFGLGLALERIAVLFLVVKFVGAAYVAYLGVQMIRHRRGLREAFHSQVVKPRRSMGSGFVVGVTNVKSLTFFVIALPGFVNPAGPVAGQILLLGALFPLVTLVVTSAWGLGAAGARNWFTRSPRRLNLVGTTGGVAMIGLGASLAVTGRSS
jgi:threonine/homoserine/homoserine lactone efflux protein